MQQYHGRNLIPSRRIQTNSSIQLAIPHQYQSGCLSFVWSSDSESRTNGHEHPHNYNHKNKKNTSLNVNLKQFILSKASLKSNKAEGKKNELDYICCPLDLGRIIKVKIQQETILQKILFQQLQYGPVFMQDNLIGSIDPKLVDNVQIFFNRNITKMGKVSLSLIDNCEPSLQKECSDMSVEIRLRVDNFQYRIIINQQISKRQINNFQSQSFFKFYQLQPHAVGLYISHQAQQFIQRIKQLDILYHFGHYLKIYFANRTYRDAFLFNFMHLAGIQDHQLEQFVDQYRQLLSCDVYHKTGDEPLLQTNNKPSIIANNIQIPYEYQQKSTKIKSKIGKNTLKSFQLLRISLAQNQSPKIREDILQDIYSILQNPVSQIQMQERQNSTAQGSSGINQSVNLNMAIERDAERGRFEHKMIKTFQKLSKPPQLNNDLYAESIRLQENMLIDANKFRYKPSRLGCNSTNQNRNSKDSQQKNVNTEHVKQLKQTSLLQKIDELNRLNQLLISQNRTLKQENQKLKVYASQVIAKSQLPNSNIRVDRECSIVNNLNQINKMMEIKTMVQLMAKKLELLQQQSHNNKQLQLQLKSSRKFFKKTQHSNRTESPSRNAQQLKNAQVQYAGPKKMWNQDIHNKIIKNVKQKGLLQKQKIQKLQQKTSQKKQVEKQMASGIEKTIDSAKLSFCKAITKNKYKQLKQCKSLNQIGELALNTGMAQSVQKYNVLGSSRKLGDLFSKNKSPKKVAAQVQGTQGSPIGNMKNCSSQKRFFRRTEKCE